MRLSRRDLAGGADASCMLEARITNLASFGEAADGYPWASAADLEGRSTFEAFVDCVQPGRGPALRVASVAAVLLIASGQTNRNLGR